MRRNDIFFTTVTMRKSIDQFPFNSDYPEIPLYAALAAAAWYAGQRVVRALQTVEPLPSSIVTRSLARASRSNADTYSRVVATRNSASEHTQVPGEMLQ